MSSVRLLLAEIRFRKLNFVMSLLAVVIAVTLFVAAPMLVDGYRQETRVQSAELEKETRRIMRDLGFNLMIVHRDTNMGDFWASDFAAKDMPQEYVNRLAADSRLTLVTHLVATLQAKIAWENRKVLLVGYLPETPQAHSAEKKPMGDDHQAGHGRSGVRVGRRAGAGETVQVLGHPFRSPGSRPEQGTKEDISIAMSLQDAQAVLQKPGRINQIMALDAAASGRAWPTCASSSKRSCPRRRSRSSSRWPWPGPNNGPWSRSRASGSRSGWRGWPRRCRRW